MNYYNVPMLNKVLIVGIVVSEPKINLTTGNKVKVANFRISCGRKFRTKAGLMKEEFCFVTITAWLRLADICEKNLKKGDKVYVEGSLQSKQFADSKMSIVEILAEHIQILTPKKILSAQSQEQISEEISENVNAPIASFKDHIEEIKLPEAQGEEDVKQSEND